MSIKHELAHALSNVSELELQLKVVIDLVLSMVFMTFVVEE